MNVPFALIGGILVLIIGHFNLSASASVGFIVTRNITLFLKADMIRDKTKERKTRKSQKLVMRFHHSLKDR
jgi:Cu/Ag efflux pump CusA